MQGKIKKLISMKNDIEMRIVEKDHQNAKNLNTPSKALQSKLNKFIIEIEITDQELQSSNLKGYDLEQAQSELSNLKSKIPSFQAKISNQSISPNTKNQVLSNDDLVLQNLTFLKEISNQMLTELESQNKKIESSLQGVETNKTLIEKSQNHMSCLEKTIDYLPNSCLISSMITLALIIFILTSVL